METEMLYGLAGLSLRQVHPARAGQWSLTGERMAIGRDPSSDVFVDDTGISRHHADLIRHNASWTIVDTGSTNGTFVNGTRVGEAALRPNDRIRLGRTELLVASADPGRTDYPNQAASYDVGWQQGNVNNVAGDQANYYREGNLRYIASRRGRARSLVISGILLFLVGDGVGFFDVLNFDRVVFNAINSAVPNEAPPHFPAVFIPLIGLAGLSVLLGITLFIFGLIVRSDAKRKARRLGEEWL